MRKDLCSAEKLLIGVIDMSEGETDLLSDQMLSEMLGICVRTVKENLMRLEAKGYIKRIHGGKKRSILIQKDKYRVV